LTKIIMGSHTGTHLDAPRHFIQDGIGIDRIPPDKLIGEAYVADLSKKPIGSGITSKDLWRELDKKIVKGDIVVVYTGCSTHWGEESINRDYTYLTGDAANYLVSKGYGRSESIFSASRNSRQQNPWCTRRSWAKESSSSNP